MAGQAAALGGEERQAADARLIIMRRARLLLVAVLLACGACTGDDSDGIARSVEPGKPVLNTAPPMPGDGRDVELTVRDGGLLDILTWGSGSCPYVPVEMERVSRQRVRVVMEQRSRDGAENPDCTADLSPTVATVALPDDVRYRESFRLDLEGVGPDRALGVGLGFTNAGGGGTSPD